MSADPSPQPRPRRRPPARQAPAAPAPPPPADAASLLMAPLAAHVRLIIETAEEPDSDVYIFIDRRTGEEVNRFARQEMLRRVAQGAYVAGDGFSFQA